MICAEVEAMPKHGPIVHLGVSRPLCGDKRARLVAVAPEPGRPVCARCQRVAQPDPDRESLRYIAKGGAQ